MIRFRQAFNGVSALVLLSLLYHRSNFVNLPSLRWSSRGRVSDRWSGGHDVIHRRMAQVTITSSNYGSVVDHSFSENMTMDDPYVCNGLYTHEGYSTHCEYLIAHPECHAGGFFNYFAFLYCDCKNVRFLGYAVLSLWLAALLYLLGNTAADYFCCSLEKLSGLLKLPATVAGVSLLPLGNGAPDVFASIAAFASEDAGDVGLNSVLGGAIFVCCIVVGVVSLSLSDRRVQIDGKCFTRDICFFLFSLISLAAIIMVGEVTIWSALAFISIYVVYAFAVAANELLREHAEKYKLDAITPLLPERGRVFSHVSAEDEPMHCFLLESVSDSEVPHLESELPQWMWASNVSIFSNHEVKDSLDSQKFVWGWNDEETEDGYCEYLYFKLLMLLEVPLKLPRRLTIPIVEEERWSKFYAVASASLAPMLIAFVWNTKHHMISSSATTVYMIGVAIGGTLGVLAFLCTTSDHPPRKSVFPWVMGGFVMSIVWFYIIATEVVDLLLALGIIFGISPSILGLTVLAWGNSVGDLVSNVALAMNGKDGVQVAMSGCYAGPMFNILAGLGTSLLLAAWSSKPDPFTIPKDGTLFYTMGFLFVALMWSLIVLPRNNMCPNKTLGVGLMLIYVVFLLSSVSISIDGGT